MQTISRLEFELLKALEEPRTRDELVEMTGFPRTTIFDQLRKWMLAGKIEKSRRVLVDSKGYNTRGRPRVVFHLHEGKQ